MHTVSENIPPVELRPGEIHLWLTFPDEIDDESLLAGYKQMMTPEEHKRCTRFRFQRHRHQYLVTRALARTMLSHYTGIDPSGIRFLKNRYGKPAVMLSKKNPPIRFNLSHTQGLIACGVVLERDIGVDIEDMRRRKASLGIADRFFSEKEAHDLRQLSEERRRERFYDYWTLKESYIKARGKGLSIPLGQFAFHISDDEPLRISFDPRLKDHSENWRFWLLKPTDQHKAAISVCNKGKQEFLLTVKKAVPMAAIRDYECEILKSCLESI